MATPILAALIGTDELFYRYDGKAIVNASAAARLAPIITDASTRPLVECAASSLQAKIMQVHAQGMLDEFRQATMRIENSRCLLKAFARSASGVILNPMTAELHRCMALAGVNRVSDSGPAWIRSRGTGNQLTSQLDESSDSDGL
jgi:hypothetical protein